MKKNQKEKRRIKKMKKLFIVLMALTLTAGFYGYSYANGLGAGITGSPHDFAADTWNQRPGEICRVCHVPHDHGRTLAIQAGIENSGLLWNHQLSAVTYTLYSSPSLDGVMGQPTGISKMCLGCHDGTVALEAMDSKAAGGALTTTYIQDVQSGYRQPSMDAGTNLKGTHPISITYDETDLGLVGIAGTAIGGATLEEVLEGGTTLQCSSCHDVHDSPGESVAGTHLLRVSNTATASGLCLTCHAK